MQSAMLHIGFVIPWEQNHTKLSFTLNHVSERRTRITQRQNHYENCHNMFVIP